MTTLALILIPLLPLVLAPLAALGKPESRAGWALALAPLPGIVVPLLLPPGAHLELPWVLLGASLGLEGMARPFLLFTSLLWWVAGLYARGYLAGHPKQRLFYPFFLLAMAGNLGLLVARDIPSFYLSFALMSFSSYPLVVHNGDAEANRAGRIYISLVVLGEVSLFSGLLLAYSSVESLLIAEAAKGIFAAPLRDLIVFFLLLGFGIKAGIVPLHLWLPLAHPVAPTPASAVLSGAMIKAGLFGVVRFLPLGEGVLPDWGSIFLAAGVLSAFYGVLMGLFQENPKTVLAYSSISQMGFLTLAVGIALGAPEGWPGIAGALSLYALHHALAKGALFLGVGVAPAAGRRGWGGMVSLGLLIPALALAGAPLTSGSLAKVALKGHLSLAPPWFSTAGGWVLSAAAVGTTVLMGRFFFLLWRVKGQGHRPKGGMVAAWGGLVGAVMLLPWGVADPKAVSYALTPASVLSTLWPLILGGALAGLGLTGRIPTFLGRLKIPPGDLVVPLERGAAFLLKLATEKAPRAPAANLPALPAESEASLAAAERGLRRWNAVGIIFLLLIVLQLLLAYLF